VKGEVKQQLHIDVVRLLRVSSSSLPKKPTVAVHLEGPGARRFHLRLAPLSHACNCPLSPYLSHIPRPTCHISELHHLPCPCLQPPSLSSLPPFTSHISPSSLSITLPGPHT
jgi:hypothetical protein